MKKTLLYLLLFSVSAYAQIINGGFEQWSMGEPVGWQTNNINEPKVTSKPITQSSFVHGGTSALKGEVLAIKVDGPTFTHSPILVSGNLTNPTFSYNGRPEKLRGFYNFQSVGGDGFIANAFLLNGENIVAVSGFTNYSSTGSGYHELLLHFNYVDTVTIPNAIQILFQIGPAPGEIFANVGSTFYIDDFPKMTLIKPEESPEESGEKQPVFIAGEVDTIKWNAGGALNINIEYSTNNGSSFQTIVNNYPADSSRYFWAVPGSLLTREAQIKIVESQNINNEIKSIDFTIKPWQLTRLDASNNLELFEPNEDGWAFSNSTNNIWPQSWWQQFDYSGIDPITGEDYPWWFPFAIAADSVFPDWPLFVEVFGQENCYLFGNSYRSEATTHWNGLWRGIAGPWGGSCAGFAVTSILGFYHKSEFLSEFPNIGNFTDLNTVPINDGTRHAINYIYAHQYGQEIIDHRRAGISKSPRELLSEIKEIFSKETGESRSLNYYNNNRSGAHAVTPYKLRRVGTGTSFNLFVYDSRVPGSDQLRILIDSSQNQWTDITGLNWGTGTSGCFLDRESITFLSRPTIPDASTYLPLKEQPAGGGSNLIMYNSSSADILITSSTGENIGFQDSIAFSNIPEGIPIIPLIGRFHPPIGYDLPADNYALYLSNFTSANSYVLLLSDSTIYNYRRFDADNNETDLLNYSENGIGISNPDPVNKTVNLETVVLKDTISEKVFLTTNIVLSAGDSIKVREVNRNNLLLNNYSDAMSYDLHIRIASFNGQKIFEHSAIPMEQNSGHQIVPDWNDLQNEPVKILIDLGNDGTIDDSIFVKNQATNVEDEGSLITPDEYNLAQNYPNPFNPTTTITFTLPKQDLVVLKVYNILGQEVATLINEVRNAGRYSKIFDASQLPSGVYIYKLTAGSFTESRKMILLR